MKGHISDVRFSKTTRYVEPKVVFWRKNLWRNNCGDFFEFQLLELHKCWLNSHGIDYIQYAFTIFNFQFVWRIRRR